MANYVASAMVAVGIGILCGCLGVYVAMQKNRSEGEGFFLGALLGPFGVLLAALLPTQEKPEREVRFHNGPPDEDWESIQRRMR